MNDEFLKRYRRAPRPEFADRLYERIASPMHTQPPRRAGRLAWLTGAAMLASLCFALLLFPTARAFADGIWHQIGAYVFVQSGPEPSDRRTQKQNDMKAAAAAATAGKPAPADATKQAALSAPAPVKAAEVSAAEASQQAGFTVLAPSYVPAGYVPNPGFVVDTQPEGVSVMTAYVGADNHGGIKLIEFKLAAGHDPISYAWPDARDVTVRGQPGLLLLGDTQSLIWEENGITFSLVGESLSQDELMKIADGLK